MTKLEFVYEIKKIFPNIDNDVFEKIEIYKDFLLKENKKFNLTNFDSEDKVYLNYFYESIAVYDKKYFKNDINVLDIGSGSGIPGILLKIFFPNINLFIIESNLKKCNFIKTLSNMLSIDVVVINSRAEIEYKNFIEYFDIVTSRAVARLSILLEIMSPYLKINGLVIQPKSVNYKSEIEEANKIIKLLNYEFIKIEYMEITHRSHSILYFLKTDHTPKNFPREWKDIIK